MATFSCACGRKLRARDEDAGKRTKCPDCGRVLTIPGPEGDAEEADTRVRPKATARRAREEAEVDDDDEAEVDEEETPRKRSKRRRPDRSRSAKTSGMAITSLILGILSLCLTLVAGVPALILGALSLVSISRGDGRVKGRGLAIAGLVTGALGCLLFIPAMMVFKNVRQAAGTFKDRNNLMQLTLAMHSYHDAHGHFPPALVYDQNGRPLYSWRVLILPYLEQGALYSQFHLDEPWDSPHNKTLLAQMPQVYAPPVGVKMAEPYSTFFQVFDGPGAIYDSNRSRHPPVPVTVPGATQPLYQSDPLVRLGQSFTDGTANTILIAEAGDAVPWTKPADLAYAPNQPLPRLGGYGRPQFLIGMVDGTQHMLNRTVSEQTLRALITPAGRDSPNPAEFP